VQVAVRSLQRFLVDF